MPKPTYTHEEIFKMFEESVNEDNEKIAAAPKLFERGEGVADVTPDQGDDTLKK